MTQPKFMQTLDPHVFRDLKRIAKQRGVSVQELIRVEAVPNWLYGPIRINNRTIQKLQRKGLLKQNGEEK